RRRSNTTLRRSTWPKACWRPDLRNCGRLPDLNLIPTATRPKRQSMRVENKADGLAATFVLIVVTVAGGAAANGDLELVDAAKNQDQQKVRALLSQRADANTRSDDGSTALLWAAHWNDVETARLLIHAGADANVANDFRVTPLSAACTNGSAAL